MYGMLNAGMTIPWFPGVVHQLVVFHGFLRRNGASMVAPYWGMRNGIDSFPVLLRRDITI
jgi:hypothetical protein